MDKLLNKGLRWGLKSVFWGLLLNLGWLTLALAHEPAAVFVIIGAKGRIDQEYNPYVQSLAAAGYQVTIHSFDPFYGDPLQSADNELSARIRECTETDHDCEVVAQGLNSPRFKNLNYFVYEDVRRDFILAKRYDPHNAVTLIRYTSALTNNNRNGQYIKQLLQEAYQRESKIVLIDSVWCGGLQPITQDLFTIYGGKIAFIHAVHNRAQKITPELVALAADRQCTAPENPLTYKYRCIYENNKLGKEIFNEFRKTAKLVQRYADFTKMPLKTQKEFTTAMIKLFANERKTWSSESCLNDLLTESKYQEITEALSNPS